MDKTEIQNLAQHECEACRADAPRVTVDHARVLLQQLPDWLIEDRAGVNVLVRSYSFKNFVCALAFTNAVGELAEAANHHPAILTEWGSVTVNWWTHKINGLHQNDFIMAAKTDQLYQARAHESR